MFSTDRHFHPRAYTIILCGPVIYGKWTDFASVATTLSIMMLSVMTFSVMPVSITVNKIPHLA